MVERWDEALNQKIAEIGEDVEATENGASVRIDYKFKVSEARNFITFCRLWIDANEKMLVFLGENFNQFGYEAPIFNFYSHSTLNSFLDLYAEKEEALEKVQKYTPFRMMIY